MTDAAAILASLDRFVDQIARHRQLIDGHRVATRNQPLAMMNLLRNRDKSHPGHFGHSKQETLAGADKERSEPRPSPAENSGAGLARRILFVDGYNGQNGKSFQNRGLADGHHETASGQNGNSASHREVVGGLIDACSHSGQDLVSPVDTLPSEAIWWRGQYQERFRHFERGGRRSRTEAEFLAWGELEWRWHMQHGEGVPPGICGGCHKPIGAAENIRSLTELTSMAAMGMIV